MPKNSGRHEAPGAIKETNNYPQGKTGSKVMQKTRVGSNPGKGGGINRKTAGAGRQN